MKVKYFPWLSLIKRFIVITRLRCSISFDISLRFGFQNILSRKNALTIINKNGERFDRGLLILQTEMSVELWEH